MSEDMQVLLRALLLGAAEIMEAGAQESRRFTFNMDRRGDAEVLEAMAEMARGLARTAGTS